MNNKFRIPKATARRLPLYYRYLLLLNDEGKDKVSSTELAEASKSTALQSAGTFLTSVPWASGVTATTSRTCSASLRRSSTRTL